MVATLTRLLIPVVAVVVIWKMIARNATPRVACRDCHTVGRAKKEEAGSFTLELVLWCLFIVPGFAYALWRSREQSYHCPSCGSEELVAASSEEGRGIRDRGDGS